MGKKNEYSVKGILKALGKTQCNEDDKESVALLVGTRLVADAMGVGETAVMNWRKSDRFPADCLKWLKAQCEPLGYDVASERFESLFIWRQDKIPAAKKVAAE